MKHTRMNKASWQTILSIGVLLIFAFIAASTWDEVKPKPVVTVHPNGTATERRDNPKNGQSETTVGNWDAANKRFTGQVTITYTDKYTDFLGRETVNMKDGKRHGKANYTKPDGSQVPKCYQNGEPVDMIHCEGGSNKSAVFSLNNNSAFSIFSNNFPWFAFKLDAFGYDPEYVQSYLDTLELVLFSSEFGEEEFDSFYEDVIDVLSVTPFDSLIQLNDYHSFYNGIELILFHEFRLATIYSYREGDGNTYQVVKSIFPNYLLDLNTAEVTDSDFEVFCSDYDSIMDTYVPVAPDDPFFIDSLEERMYRTLDLISSGDESSESQSLKSAWSSDELGNVETLKQKFLSQYRIQAVNKTPKEVSDIIFFSIIIEFLNGDLLKDAVRDAFALKQGIVRLPTVVTDFLGSTSSTSVSVYGNVIDDGGGEITSKGIAWAQFYNPTIDNQVVAAGSGTGEFNIPITELSEGETYYARTFATNSAGTAYGNCISFVAGSASGIDAPDESIPEYSIYPNPASDHITLSIKAKDSNPMVFYLCDMSGKVVLQKEVISLAPGDNTIRVNLSEVESGSYICRLKGDEGVHATEILMISR